MGINYEVTRFKILLLINGVNLFGRMSDHVTAIIWFMAWILMFTYSCLLL